MTDKEIRNKLKPLIIGILAQCEKEGLSTKEVKKLPRFLEYETTDIINHQKWGQTIGEFAEIKKIQDESDLFIVSFKNEEIVPEVINFLKKYALSYSEINEVLYWVDKALRCKAMTDKLTF